MNRRRESWLLSLATWKLRAQILWLRLSLVPTRRVYSRVLDRSVALLSTRLRLQFDLPLATDDKNVDRAVSGAISIFLLRTPEECHDKTTQRNFLGYLKSDGESLAVLRGLLRAQIWTSQSFNSAMPSELAETATARYRETFAEDPPSIDLRAARRWSGDLKGALRQTRRKLFEQRTDRIDVVRHLTSASIISWTIFLVPSAITIYGYVYAVSYFRHFGVDTSVFFSIGDYLAYSANKLGIVISCITGTALGSLMAMSRVSTLSRESLDAEHDRTITALHFLYVTLLLSTIVSFLLFPPLFFLALIAWIAVLSPGDRLCQAVMNRYLKRVPALSRLVGMSLTCFLLVWSSANVASHLVTFLEPRPFTVETDGARFDSSGHKFIGATSSFIFLLDDENEVDVVPQATVRSISIPNSSIGLLLDLRRWMLSHMPEWFDPDRSKHQGMRS